MSEQPHWLVRPRTIRGLWRGLIVVLAATVAANLFVHPHAYFGVDGWLGFYAVYGLGTCVLMIVGANALGKLIKRRDDYYSMDRRDET